MAIQTDLDAGHANVGDKKSLEVFAEDSSGTDLPDPEVEVEVTSPSGTLETYTRGDLIESDRHYYLRFLLDEAGHWHVRIQVNSADGQEVESGFIRAISNTPETLLLLTREVWHEYLSDAVMSEHPEKIMRLLDKAERKVIGRYRETRPHTDNYIGEAHLESNVRLDGWIEDDQSDPDLQEMDEDLLDALRESISRIVEFWVERPDPHVKSESQGARSVSYREKDLPADVYAPLRPFDDREPFIFG